MSEEHAYEETQQPAQRRRTRAPMGLFARLSALVVGLLLLATAMVSTHAAVEHMYDQLEDQCVLGVCLNRVPNS